MKTLNKSLLVLCVLSISFFKISAQEAKELWSLEDCISYALENNISLKRQELSTAITKKDYTQSKLNVLPNLNGQVSHDLGSGRVLDRNTYEWLNTDVNQGDLGVASDFTIFGGLTGYNSIKKAEAGYQMSKSNLEILENSITLQIMNAYLDLLRKQYLFDIAKEKLTVTQLQVERIEKLMEVGNAASGELLEMKAQHSAEKYNASVAKYSLSTSKLNLIQLLNIDPNTSFEIIQPELSDPSLLQISELDTIYDRALKNLPQIMSAKHNIKYYQKDLAIAKGNLSPELYLRGLLYSNYSDRAINPRDPDYLNPTLAYPLTDQVNDNQYRQLTVGINIPVFNRWQAQTNISKAKIMLEDAKFNLENERQTLYEEVQQYRSDALAAYDSYIAANESYVNSEEAFRYAEEKYKVGTANALELEEARNRLYEAKSLKISAKFVFIFYTKILDFYQGETINL